MSSLLQDLSASVNAKNEQAIIDNLNKILTQGTAIELSDNGIAKSLISLEKSDKITRLFIEAVAEWCKIEQNRKLFTDKTVIDFLFGLLHSSDEDLVKEAIRALGNICYENEEARKIIDTGGLETVIAILKSDESRPNKALTLKVSGFLVNLLMSNEDLQKAALRLDIVGIIERLLQKYARAFKENQMLITFLLTVLNNISDFIDDQNVPFTESLCAILIDVFKKSQTPEISVSCLEILHGQSDKDEMKTLMAKNGTCELVFDLIEKYRSEVNDEESRSVMKMACDLIVIILTGDDCMHLLYDNGKGKVYENMITWLDTDDPDLLSTGILAVGNFARKDTHCIQMVQNGISKKLIGLLPKYNTSQSDVKVQHALLSTLKNLVIPQQNKAKILAEGLIEAVYPLVALEQWLVIFKLLGTFRMVVDGQESAALDLISRKDFIKKLVHWCYDSDHLGVRGEVPRLLAWLVKHCRSFKPLPHVIRTENAVKCLVEMTSSNHAVMQNESFYALTVLCKSCQNNRCCRPTTAPSSSSNNNNKDSSEHDAGCPADANKSNGLDHAQAATDQDGGGGHDDCSDLLYRQLISADVGKNLTFVVNKYSDKMDQHTIENLLSLLEQFLNSQDLMAHLRSSDLPEALSKLARNSSHVQPDQDHSITTPTTTTTTTTTTRTRADDRLSLGQRLQKLLENLATQPTGQGDDAK